MGQDQRDLDIPVLLEVRHFLDKAAEDPPTQFLWAFEQRRAEFWANLLESGHRGQLALLVGLPVDPGELGTESILVL